MMETETGTTTLQEKILLTFIINTPRNERNKFVVPMHPEIPEDAWGKEVDSPYIKWWGYPSPDKFKKTLVILGDPLAQKRHRVTGIPGSADGTRKQSFRQYDPGAASKGDFLSIIQKEAPEIPLTGAVRLDCYFYFQRPSSHYGSGKNAGVLKSSSPTYKISKPDRDNLDKFVLDAMSKVYWKDDSQVCAGEILKVYDEKPRTVLVITEL